MPTYDYRCDDCGYGFEIFQGMLEKKLTECPKCQGRVRRLIGAGAGIVFKGSGFYETDYRSSDYRKKSAADKGEPKASSGDAKKKPEAPKKPDAGSSAPAPTGKGDAKS